MLFTDYGLEGPYLGQVEAAINNLAPEQRVINLISNVPRQNPKAAAYLLSSLVNDHPKNTIFFCVVDPGVGTFVDTPVVLRLDERWFVGPDNGQFDIVARNSKEIECWEIHWRPEKISATFHGRDIYAPISAMIANGLDIPGERFTWQDRNKWPANLYEIIYIDHFGNCVTGIKAQDIDKDKLIRISDHAISHAETFASVEKGQMLWYENSSGLVEIAVNQGSAEDVVGLSIGSKVTV